MARRWEPLGEGLWRFQDSCMVYAVRGPAGTVVVNAGTGRGAETLPDIEPGDVTVLLTHHFRDHTDGALAFGASGATIMAPVWESEYLIDPAQHFRERQTWNSYDNRWDRFSPIRPIPVNEFVHDWDRRMLGGLEWEVIPAPGVTTGAVNYVTTIAGRRVAFTGETIAGPGRLPRLAPLQYDYNDLHGAVNVWHTCRRLLKADLRRLYPSLGEPIDDAPGALHALREALKTIGGMHPGFENRLTDPDDDDLEEVLPRLWRSKYAWAETHFVKGDSGRILSLDYGYHGAAYVQPGKQHLSNRRPFPHGLDGLEKREGHRKIDTILVSHYHDDHVNGIPMIQRLCGAEVWAPENVADILENPEKYDRPCLWHEPIKVSRRLKAGERVLWDGIPITTRPMSGHTRFSALLCLEIDGTRVAHTGDQIFSDGKGGEPFGPQARQFTNHVYKNGLDAGCYKDSLALLREFNPDLVLTGHTRPYKPGKEWFGALEAGANAFDAIHEHLGSCDADGVHFGFEGQGGKLKPYRVHLPEAVEFEFDGWILNPFDTAARATATLVVPAGWTSGVIEVRLGPRERKEIRIACFPEPGMTCRRLPIALDLVVNDRPFGQVCEALVTIGDPNF